MTHYIFNNFSLLVSLLSPTLFTYSAELDKTFYTGFRGCPGTNLEEWYDFTPLIQVAIPTLEEDYRSIVLYEKFKTVDVLTIPQDKLLRLFENVLDYGSWESYFRMRYYYLRLDQFCLWDYVDIDRERIWYHKHDFNDPSIAFSTIEKALYGIPYVLLYSAGGSLFLQVTDFSRDSILAAIPSNIPDYNYIYDTLELKLPEMVIPT